MIDRWCLTCPFCQETYQSRTHYINTLHLRDCQPAAHGAAVPVVEAAW